MRQSYNNPLTNYGRFIMHFSDKQKVWEINKGRNRQRDRMTPRFSLVTLSQRKAKV